MTYRLQNTMLAMLLALTTLFVGFGTLSQNPTSGGYQLFERSASGISADIQLAPLGNFAPSPETASECCNATNNAGEVITGARTLSRMDAEGWDLAEDFYEQMRRSGGSVDEIAKNTGLSRGAVQRAYRHLFLDSHQLDDGLRRFDADPEIVNAWNRMRNGTHTTADIDLVNHERFEAILMQRYGQPYRCAHAAANACGFQSPIDD